MFTQKNMIQSTLVIGLIVSNVSFANPADSAAAETPEQEAKQEVKQETQQETPAPKAKEELSRTRYRFGAQASDITGSGFLIRQQLTDNTEIDYIIRAAVTIKTTEAGSQKDENKSVHYDLGVSYRTLLADHPLSTHGTFDWIGGGSFVGAHIGNDNEANIPKGAGDFDTLTAALGGGLYLGTAIGAFQLEASAGLRYEYSQTKKFITQYDADGKETEKSFGLGYGFSATYGF